MKNKVQQFGKFLSGMVMPNIGALIAFGFLAALFIDTGWIPNEKLNSMVSPILTYLIPILIASTGGKMVGGDRGRVVGAIAVIGAIMSDTSITMLMAAMIIGPLGGFCIKKFDEAMDGHMPAGFEMLINNFSAGIIGMLLAILGYTVVGPVMSAILVVLAAGVNILVVHGLLPLVAIFIEPAKVLFLNNAINHGIFTPLATAQAAETGKSIMYMLEPNPGPGLGVLLAYMFFCKDMKTKQSAPGAIIIHVLGGIHEIYFPYILMNPLVIIAPIIGNMVSIFWFNMMDCGLVGPASPGSIIAYLMMTPGSDIWKVLVGVVIATGVSFAVASPIVKMAGGKNSLEAAQAEMAAMKAEAKELQKLCKEYKVPFIINDNVDIAVAMNADGVHVGQSDMEAGDVRAKLGPDKIIGVSTQTVEQAILAEKHGADYLGVGAVFPTTSKDDAAEVSYDTLKAICEAVSIPVVAIGGITQENVVKLTGSGIDGVAVISAIYAQKDIKKAAADLKAAVKAIV